MLFWSVTASCILSSTDLMLVVIISFTAVSRLSVYALASCLACENFPSSSDLYSTVSFSELIEFAVIRSPMIWPSSVIPTVYGPAYPLWLPPIPSLLICRIFVAFSLLGASMYSSLSQRPFSSNSSRWYPPAVPVIFAVKLSMAVRISWFWIFRRSSAVAVTPE